MSATRGRYSIRERKAEEAHLRKEQEEKIERDRKAKIEEAERARLVQKDQEDRAERERIARRDLDEAAWRRTKEAREASQFNRTFLTTLISVVVTVLLGFSTALLAMHNQLEQAKDDLVLKASEIAISSQTPDETAQRLQALKELLGGRLPDDFGKGFKSSSIGGPEEPSKREVFMAIYEHPDHQNDIITLYEQIYPEKDTRDWLESLRVPPKVGP